MVKLEKVVKAKVFASSIWESYMSKTGRGSNAFEGVKGFQKVTKRPSKAPTISHKTLTSNDETPPQVESESKQLTRAYEVYKNKIQRKGRAPILEAKQYLDAFLNYGVQEEVARKASLVLSTNPPLLLSTSGKLASGKDTISKLVINKLGEEDINHLSLSAPLKDEAQEILESLRSAGSQEEAVESVMKANVSREQAKRVVELAYDGARQDLTLTTRDRTNWIRSLLQYWGMEVRRGQDENYWLNKATIKAAKAIANNENIMITDVRFPGEVERLQTIGFTVLRLDINEEVQAKRLDGRDGLAVDPVALVHPSETALDDFSGFNIRVENNYASLEEVVDSIVTEYR